MKFELKPVKSLPLRGIDITPILDAFIKQDSDICELSSNIYLSSDNLKQKLQKAISINSDYTGVKIHRVNNVMYLSRNVNTVVKVI